MRFTQDSTSASNLVRASAVQAAPDIRSMEDLAALDPSRILSQGPELVLLGTGPRQIFPAASFRAQFLSAGIGFEVMDTGAACRTFNVLVAEQRPVVALL